MAKKNNSIVLFDQKQVRRHWDEDKELWYFSIVDIIGILTDSSNSQVYWRVLKKDFLMRAQMKPLQNVTL